MLLIYIYICVCLTHENHLVTTVQKKKKKSAVLEDIADGEIVSSINEISMNATLHLSEIVESIAIFNF